MDFIIVVPAKGNSSRIPKKNLQTVGGMRLIERALKVVHQVNATNFCIVSSNDSEILSIAKTYNCFSHRRNEDLCCADSTTESVLYDILTCGKYFSEKSVPKWVVTLQPTSPFRTEETLGRILSILDHLDEDIDCLMTVHEDYNDFWYATAGSTILRLMPDNPRRQQDRAPLMVENGCIYATRSDVLMRRERIIGNNTLPFTINPVEGFDINTPLDLLIARTIAESDFNAVRM